MVMQYIYRVINLPTINLYLQYMNINQICIIT